MNHVASAVETTITALTVVNDDDGNDTEDVSTSWWLLSSTHSP